MPPLAASSAARAVFWHFTIAFRGLWYALAVLSVLVFLYGVA
jgi:hypothetical protein